MTAVNTTSSVVCPVTVVQVHILPVQCTRYTGASKDDSHYPHSRPYRLVCVPTQQPRRAHYRQVSVRQCLSVFLYCNCMLHTVCVYVYHMPKGSVVALTFIKNAMPCAQVPQQMERAVLILLLYIYLVSFGSGDHNPNSWCRAKKDAALSSSEPVVMHNN